MDDKANDKQVFIWNLIGNVLYAFTSMVLLLLVNRILGIRNGDTFSIGFAIAQLMLSIGNFQIRLYQATDVKEKFKFVDYWYFRLLTCFLMIVVSLIYTLSKDYQISKTLVVLVFCVYRLGDAFSDVYEGRLQQIKRLDIAGKSLAVKVFYPVLLFSISIIFTKDLLFSSLVLTITEFICIYFYTIKKSKYFFSFNIKNYSLFSKEKLNIMKQMLIISFPLFINSYVMNSIYNTPKIVIDGFIENGTFLNGLQVYYNILFLPAFVMNLIVLIFRGVITEMAHDLYHKQINNVYKKMLVLVIIIIIITVLAIGVAYVIGIPILSLVYGTGDALYQYKSSLIIIMIGGGINAIATILDNVITIFRKHHLLTISYILSWIIIKLISTDLILSNGLYGASLSFLIAMIVLLLAVIGILIFSIISYQKESKRREKIYGGE